MDRERRIRHLCYSHAITNDDIWNLQLISIAKGLAEPAGYMLSPAAPCWMKEIVKLCRERR